MAGGSAKGMNTAKEESVYANYGVARFQVGRLARAPKARSPNAIHFDQEVQCAQERELRLLHTR